MKQSVNKPGIIKNKETFMRDNDMLHCNLPFNDDISILANPVRVGGKIIPNRLVYQPMEGCDGESTGEPGSLTVRRYDRFAKGGAGLIWLEATAVQIKARANPRQLYISKNTLDSFRKLINGIKEAASEANGKEPVVIMQLTHSGRYSRPDGYPEPLIVYNNPLFEKDNPIPTERILSDDQLDRVRNDIVEASYLAQLAGFDGVDIKSCHRYLISETLSGYLRKGRYGGSFENRTRLLTEAIGGAVQRCDSKFLISTRLNIYDGFPYPYGFGVNEESGLEPDLTEAIALVRRLADMGIKLINITMGNPYVNPHVNRPFLRGGYVPDEHPLSGVARILRGISEIQKNVPDIPVISSGLTYLGAVSPQVASACINEGWFSMAGYGRMTLAYPDLANDIVHRGGLNSEKCCITCGMCSQIMRHGGTAGCVVRDKDVYLPIYRDLHIT